MRIGSVFEQTSTTDFLVMLAPDCNGEKLLFSYVELSPDGKEPNSQKERIIARIKNVYKENPLLSRDQAGISASIDLDALGIDYSRRFTYGWAECSVIGALIDKRLDMNRRVIAPNAQVHIPSDQTLRELFFNPSPAFVPLGTIETFGVADQQGVPVTLNADQMVTKHFCIFGMTGSGKTNTSAKLLEEFMARGQRMIVFDSHDDYQNIENFQNLFPRIGQNGITDGPSAPIAHGQAVTDAITHFTPQTTNGRQLEECVYERLVRAASVINNNTPAHRVVQNEHMLSSGFIQQLAQSPWNRLIGHPQVRHLRAFPELRYYGGNFADFSINLLEAFQGEAFSDAQRRWLRDNINQRGTGIQYLRSLWTAVHNDPSMQSQTRASTREVLEQKFNSLQAIYRDAASSGGHALDLETMFQEVAIQNSSLPETLYRLSLSDLSSNIRKAMVFGIVTYFFRQFKFGGYRVRPSQGQHRAYPVLFVLEEARSLIPKSSSDDIDIAGKLARRAMREIAYEGRKFSLGFGLISQKPSTIDPEVVSQSNTFILHQLKSPDDQEYVRSVTESMSRDELEMIKSLGTGRAIVAGVAIQSPVLLRIYPRYSQEGIQEPTPISDELSSVHQIREQLNISQT